MQDNDAGAATVGDYLVALVRKVWKYGEGFSGKRPFGNSGWEYDIYLALGEAGLIEVSYDESGYYLQEVDRDAADALVNKAIDHLWEPPPSDPEHDLARDPDTGGCQVCEAAEGEAHDLQAHDRWEAGDDATWD